MYNKRFYNLYSPTLIEEELNRTVKGQQKAVHDFSLQLYKYMVFKFMLDNKVDNSLYFAPDHAIFLGGPTGSGKYPFDEPHHCYEATAV